MMWRMMITTAASELTLKMKKHEDYDDDDDDAVDDNDDDDNYIDDGFDDNNTPGWCPTYSEPRSQFHRRTALASRQRLGIQPIEKSNLQRPSKNLHKNSTNSTHSYTCFTDFVT